MSRGKPQNRRGEGDRLTSRRPRISLFSERQSDDVELVANKTGPTRLGFGVLLRFFELEARFPRSMDEVPVEAVDFVGRQLGVRLFRLADNYQAARPAGSGDGDHQDQRDAAGTAEIQP